MIQARALEQVEADVNSPLLERLFDGHQRRLYRLARRLSSSREEAEDLVQETFLRAAGALARLPRGSAAEEAWLVRILVNLARDAWRRRRVRTEGRAPHSSQGPSPLPRVASRPASDDDVAGASPEPAYLARLAVQTALARLSPRRRAVVVLHELEGMEARDVARLLGVAAVTVRWHLSLGRRELARLLRTEGNV